MNVGSRQKNMDAWTGSVLQSLPRALDVRPAGARQSRNDGAADLRGDRPHRFEVAVGSDGESRLDHVHTQAVELMSQTQLFRLVHAAAGRLLAVAKRSVENCNAGSLCGHDFLKRDLPRNRVNRLW